MDRGPQRAGGLIKPRDGGLVGQIAGDQDGNTLAVAQTEPLRLRLVEARHVAIRASLEQHLDHGGAERPGASRDDDVTTAEIHSGLLRDAASSPIRAPGQDVSSARFPGACARKIRYPAALG